ncbi:ClpP/crotonase-like domain-containing protein [Blastocladiella britannica]|nr:ClpP/crotonase-like domain-containing protein [Blastocladiella britannica]
MWTSCQSRGEGAKRSEKRDNEIGRMHLVLGQHLITNKRMTDKELPVLTSDLNGNRAVRVLTLNRPRSGNSLAPDLVSALLAALAAAVADPTVRVVVLAARGKYFCSGMRLDPAALAGGGGAVSSSPDTMFAAVRDCPLPTIALLQGPALGGGIGLALSCDLRVATRAAHFAFPEARRGIVPAYISPASVAALGQARALRYMLTGDRVPVDELVACGAVSAVVDSEPELAATADRLAASLVKGAPAALSLIKQLVFTVSRAPHLDPATAAFIKSTFEGMMSSADAVEGISAFAEKRLPSWDPSSSTPLLSASTTTGKAKL